MNLRLFLCVMLLGILGTKLTASESVSPALEVAFPEGYRAWQHVSTAVLKPSGGSASGAADGKLAEPHGTLGNIYANEKAVEGYRTGQFPEGAVLVVDWFVLKEKGPQLLQDQRKSVNVMVRDARFTATGGWGFEDFKGDSQTVRNVGPKAVEMCFKCHTAVMDREYVFTKLNF